MKLKREDKKLLEKKWTTWDGRNTNMNKIDHQHLSNIYWYNKIVQKQKANWVFNYLELKFNGQLLPYRPHVRFQEEIDYRSGDTG